MTIITGDTHGDFQRLSNKNMKENPDYVIITGDFGLIWTAEDKEELYWKKWLSEKPFEVIVVLGNHENYDRIYNLPIEQRYGNTLYKYSDNIYILIHGLNYIIDNKSYFVYGGAKSTDKHLRIHKFPKLLREYVNIMQYNKHYYIDFENDYFIIYGNDRKYKLERKEQGTWWKEEAPDDSYKEQALITLKDSNHKFDYVLSHTAPRTVIENLRKDYKVCEVSELLQAFSEKLECKKWFFGHLHIDKSCKVAGIEYRCLYKDRVVID